MEVLKFKFGKIKEFAQAGSHTRTLRFYMLSVKPELAMSTCKVIQDVSKCC